ncbi:SOS response-associated peptidase family protein [Brucella sp. NBRC 113783]|uniref:SOS response-associated peptidase family protein n=1 Tax=Brucella sp. NBRC 113783 TaxID=3075478 RepID=UPI00333EC60A
MREGRRCQIPADGFYKWTKNADDGGRAPWHMDLPEHSQFSFTELCTTEAPQPWTTDASVYKK